MSASNQQFIDAVQKSRVLSTEQKDELLADPEAFPESYREKVIGLLQTFDAHSMARERELRLKLEESYRTLEKQLIEQGIAEEKRTELLKQARKQINEFFPDLSA